MNTTTDFDLKYHKDNITMRTHIFILTLLVATFSYAQKLPILEVEFPGKFEKEMDYVQGKMKLKDVDGTIVELPAKFKTRGATALNYSMKPSFNMKLREADGTEIDSSLCGIRSCSSWILDAMAIDRIGMRNRVSFDVWNAFSKLPYYTDFGRRSGTKGLFVEVYINKEYNGIYCLSDRINRKLLDLKKVKINEDGTHTVRGVLYKHGTTSLEDQNTPGFFNDSTVCVAEWHDAWELKEPEDYAGKAAWQPLQDFYKNKNSYDYIKEHCFLENIVDFTLFVMAFSLSDNWGNKNHFISIQNIQLEGDKAKLVYIPWDMDCSLGGEWDGSAYGGNYLQWSVETAVQRALAPFSTCLRQNEFKEMLKARWLEAREGALAMDSVSQRLYDYAHLFVGSGAWQRQWDYFQTQRYKPQLLENLYAEVNLTAQWYEDRFHEMDRYFEIEETKIENNTIDKTRPLKRGVHYNLSGQKIQTPTRGIYIYNGKKYKK